MKGLCESQHKYCEKSYVFEISASFHFNFGCGVCHCQLYTHCRKEDNIKRVPHCDTCLINLFNVLLYINAGLRKCLCLFGQQGYFFAIPLTRYPATKHMASYVSSYVLFARYMEISMYLAMKHMATGTWKFPSTLRYVSSQGTWKFPCTLPYVSLQGTWKFPCTLPYVLSQGTWKFPRTFPYVSSQGNLAICFIARYMGISMYLEVCFVAMYMEISMYLAKVNVSLQGTWKFPCSLQVLHFTCVTFGRNHALRDKFCNMK